MSISATAGFTFSIGEEDSELDCETFVPMLRPDVAPDVCNDGEIEVPETLIFVNIDVSDSPVTGSDLMPSGDYACTFDFDSPVPVIAKTISVMNVTCTVPVVE